MPVAHMIYHASSMIQAAVGCGAICRSGWGATTPRSPQKSAQERRSPRGDQQATPIPSISELIEEGWPQQD